MILGGLAVLIVAGVVLLLVLRGGGPKRSAHGRATTAGAAGSGNQALHAAQAGGALPLGAVVAGPGGGDCAQGDDCQELSVHCPNVSHDARALVTIGKVAAPHGVVVLFSGGDGAGEFGGGRPAAAQFLDDVHAQGLETVAIRWPTGWLQASAGEEVGPALLACRPASVVSWAHDSIFAPLHLPESPGRCGFCVAGSSGGASQVSYSLSFYGLADAVDEAVIMSGPPHAALAKGCLADPADLRYAFAPAHAAIIDESYGFKAADGPCQRHDPAFTARWNKDSVDLGGSDYRYPKTRVVFLIGGSDQSEAPVLGEDYAARLHAAGSPMVDSEKVPGAGHDLDLEESGLASLQHVLLPGGVG